VPVNEEGVVWFLHIEVDQQRFIDFCSTCEARLTASIVLPVPPLPLAIAIFKGEVFSHTSVG
jgi:hypothetical protein